MNDLVKEDDEGDDGRVVVLAATNTPWSVDKAFLRSGRFDRVVFVGVPTEEERGEILGVLCDKMVWGGRERGEGLKTIMKRVAAATEGYSGADLAGLVKNAALMCVLRGGGDEGVEKDDFDEALRNSRPSQNVDDVERVKRWKL